MTNTQQIIQDAIEGGWLLGGMLEVSNLGDKYNSGTFRFAKVTNPDTGKSFSTHLDVGETFLDPTFWQAVGKTRGWSDVEVAMSDYEREHSFLGGTLAYSYEEGGDMYFNSKEWRYKQHQFIDHLAEGMDYETALSKLV